LNRREFQLALASALGGAALHSGRAGAQQTTGKEHLHDMKEFPSSWTRNEQIAMLIYPEFTALDLIGPQYMFANLMGATVHIVAKTLQPVRSDTRVTFVPSIAFEDCPKQLDILFVPGGTQGTLAAMRDEKTLEFLADRGSSAKLVTSVCTGSLLLGAAGLLRGYRATSHWITLDLLGEFGATPVADRVVFDRNRVTGAGVTAGIDFGLSLVEKMRDVEYAKAVQLLAEYDPAPPFDSGSIKKADPKTIRMLSGMLDGFKETIRAEARRQFQAFLK